MMNNKPKLSRSLPLTRILVTALLLVTLLPAGLFGAPSSTALGNVGEVYEVRAGLFGELFPDDDSQPATSPVLALDIHWADGASERLVVPGTQDEAVESAPGLVFDKASQRLSVVWRSANDDSRAILLTTSEPDGSWSEVASLWQSSPSTLSDPSIVLTHDTHSFTVDQQQRRARRSLLHLAWAEETDGGAQAAYYSPVVLVEGRYLGWNEAFDLVDLAEEIDPAQPSDSVVSADLHAAVGLTESRSGDSVIASFPLLESGEVIAIQVRVLPLEMGFLSAEIRRQMLDVLDTVGPGDVSSLAGAMRFQVIGMGLLYGYHPAMLEVLAQEISDWLQDAGDQATADAEGLADAVRDLTLQVTAELLRESGDGSGIFQIDIGDFLDGGPEPQFVEVQVRSRQPAPEVEGGHASIHASDDGAELLVAWRRNQGRTLYYVESTLDGDGAWGETQSLSIGDGLGLSEAYDLLRQRLR